MERVPWHKALFDRALARVQKSHVLFSLEWRGFASELTLGATAYMRAGGGPSVRPRRPRVGIAAR